MNYLHRLPFDALSAVIEVAGFVSVLAQAPPPNPPRPAPPALWTVTADIAAPESAFYDAPDDPIRRPFGGRNT